MSVFSSLIAAIFILTTSCATTSKDSRPEGRVIERSKQAKPVWADAPAGQLIVNATEAKIHYANTKQRDLPIAIKVTQSSAIESSYEPWRASFETRLSEFPKVLAAKNAKNQVEYTQLIEQVARKVHAQAAQVEDIYYERIRIDAADKVPELAGVSEYFDVHVLVQLLPVDSTKIRAVLQQVFSGAKAPELKRIGKDMLQETSKRKK